MYNKGKTNLTQDLRDAEVSSLLNNIRHFLIGRTEFSAIENDIAVFNNAFTTPTVETTSRSIAENMGFDYKSKQLLSDEIFKLFTAYSKEKVRSKTGRQEIFGIIAVAGKEIATTKNKNIENKDKLLTFLQYAILSTPTQKQDNTLFTEFGL